MATGNIGYRNIVLKNIRLTTYQDNCYTTNNNSNKGYVTGSAIDDCLICRKMEIILLPHDLYPHKF